MISIGYHMRGEVISVLSLESRGKVLYLVTSERSERGKNTIS